MIHIYTGCGKGKTTAAAGMAVRGAGAGFRVYFFQMMKDGSSSEIEMLQKTGVITESAECSKFVFDMTEAEKSELSEVHNKILRKTGRLIENGLADTIIIDEFFGAYSEDLLDKQLAEEIIFHAGDTEMILTGRNATGKYIERADYVTDMNDVKHPYRNGIQARRGIEY